MKLWLCRLVWPYRRETFTGPDPVEPGDRAAVDFGLLGTVSIDSHKLNG